MVYMFLMVSHSLAHENSDGLDITFTHLIYRDN